MAAFARALPQLATHAARPTFAPAAIRLAALPSSTSSARLLSSSARTAFAHHPSPNPRPSPSSAFDALRGAFAKSGSAGSKRGVATSPAPAYYGGAGSKQKVDWGKVGVNVGVGVAGAVGLNLLLNRETSPLQAHEWVRRPLSLLSSHRAGTLARSRL